MGRVLNLFGMIDLGCTHLSGRKKASLIEREYEFHQQSWSSTYGLVAAQVLPTNEVYGYGRHTWSTGKI